MNGQTYDIKQDAEKQPGRVADFVSDLMLLAAYAVEAGRLPEQVKLADIYQAYHKQIDQSLPLSAAEIELLQYYYQLLKIELDPVTPTSLRATACPSMSKPMRTPAGRRVRTMWYWSFFSLAVILAINLYQYGFEFNSATWAAQYPDWFTTFSMLYWVALAILPFAYGALGASVRLLRIMETRLRDRSFDPRRIPEHRTRWVLGTLSGGVLVLFVNSGGIGDTQVKLEQAALGFLGGYSIDLLFSILDNLVQVLSPKRASGKNEQKTRIQVPVKITEAREESGTTLAATDTQTKKRPASVV
ncbi:MAG TPA: hypothetical protein ENJ19_02970 [Gammaproteobacteria bacterium]|nr:hypothetical protein [Gammaproteobacteria bacterium]